jgi:hypothetical protein
MSETNMEFWARRQRDCFLSRRSYEMWAGLLAPIRWVMISGSTVLSLFAGATIVTQSSVFHGHGQVVAGYCALTAGILTGLHTALKCEEYQTECRRLAIAYYSLEIAFQSLERFPPDQRRTFEDELETKYESTVSTAKALVPNLFRRMAAKEIELSPSGR